MVLGSSWKKLRSLKLSLCFKLGTPKGLLLSALMYREVLLVGCGDATRGRASLLDKKGKADTA